MSIRCSWRTRTHSHDIELTVEAAAQQILGADPVIGARFDPWRVGRETGRGGMGIVYLVVRDDAQFQKHAASSSSEPVWTRRNCSPEGHPSQRWTMADAFQRQPALPSGGSLLTGGRKTDAGKEKKRSLCELLENLPAILRITWWMDFSSSVQIRKREQDDDYQDEREGRRRPAALTRTKGAHQNETNR
jgi:hypothetical protein